MEADISSLREGGGMEVVSPSLHGSVVYLHDIAESNYKCLPFLCKSMIKRVLHLTCTRRVREGSHERSQN